MRRTASDCSCSSVVGQQVIRAGEGAAYRKKLGFARLYWMQGVVAMDLEGQKEGSRHNKLEPKEKEGKWRRVAQVTL